MTRVTEVYEKLRAVAGEVCSQEVRDEFDEAMRQLNEAELTEEERAERQGQLREALREKLNKAHQDVLRKAELTKEELLELWGRVGSGLSEEEVRKLWRDLEGTP